MNPFFRVLLFIITVLFIGCNDGVESKKEETVVCGVNDPINNLKWLHNEFKQFLGGPTGNGIVLYEYQNREVIEVQSLLFSSTNIHQYYCDGAKLALEDPEKFAAFKKDRKFITMLYGTNLWN